MTKKNIQIALSTLSLLTAATSAQAEEILDYSALGTGEEIRGDILADAASTDKNPQPETQEEAQQQNKNQKKKQPEKKKNGGKSTQGKCGKGTCS